MKAEAGMDIGTEANIYVGANAQDVPAMAYDSVNKRFLVVWQSGDAPEDSNVYGQLINADGSLYGNPITISTAEGNQYNINVAFDFKRERFLVVWSDYRNLWGGPPRRVSVVYGQFISSTGTLEGDNFAITYLPGPYASEPGDASPRGLMFEPTLNRFFLLTIQCQSITYHYYHDHNLYGQFLNTDGSLSGGYFPITDPNGPISPYFYVSVLEYDTNQGRFLIAYSRYWNQFMARMLNADGSFYGNEFVIPSVSPPDRQNNMTSLAFDSFNNRFLLLWNSAAYGNGIYGQLINADGSLSGTEMAIASYPYSTNGLVIFDAACQKFFLVGNSYYNKIFGQLLNLDGSLFGPIFNISDHSVAAFLAGGSPNYLITWSTDLGTGTGKDIFGKPIVVLDDWFLKMTEMDWQDVRDPYYSTGAATASMILTYIRNDWVSQDTIYLYAKDPGPFTGELTPVEMDKALGHFDSYDALVSNWADSYDSLPDGNPYQGYNFDVDAYDPNSAPDALNNYMRDICHWMAYTVTKEDWWLDAELVARPNTPAAIPIYGTYSHWVAVNGFSASANPAPKPHINPWDMPDFTVYGFWIKDPLVSGIGQDTYKSAAECAATYFLPLSTSDSYNGKFVQVAEPPLEKSNANVHIEEPQEDAGNLDYLGIKPVSSDVNTIQITSPSTASSAAFNAGDFIKKQNWSDILPTQLLSDADCYAAFNGTQKGEPVLVKRVDVENSDYYLAPFNKRDKKGRILTSGVILLDANKGYFKEASWTKEPVRFLRVNEKDAVRLITNSILKDRGVKLGQKYARIIAYVQNSKAELNWKPNSPYSSSPYQPYWRVDANGYIIYVTQGSKVVFDTVSDTI